MSKKLIFFMHIVLADYVIMRAMERKSPLSGRPVVAMDRSISWQEIVRLRLAQVKAGKADNAILNQLVNSINPKGCDRSPLFLVAQLPGYHLLSDLLNAGADPNIDDGNVPLDVAWRKETIALLLSHGAEVKKCKIFLLDRVIECYLGGDHAHKPDAIDDAGWVAQACQTMQLLIDAGIDVNQTGPFHCLSRATSCYSPTAQLSDNSYLKTVLAYLISQGADPHSPAGDPNNTQVSVYEKLKNNEKTELVTFIQRQRRKYLYPRVTYPRVRLLWVGNRKEQAQDCFLARLPREIAREIALWVQTEVWTFE